MKKARKLITFILAAVMVLSMSMNVWAAGPGSITITNAKEDTAYSVYKILDLVSYDGEKYSYKVASGWEQFFEDSDYFTVDGDGYVVWDGSEDEGQKATEAAAVAKAALEYADDNNISPTAIEAALVDGTVEITDLELGYYLVDSAMGTLCLLDTTKPGADITEKNESPVLVKTFIDGSDKNSVSIGDEVQFKIVITVKDGAKGYILHDAMSAGLTYDPNSLTIKVGGIDVEESNYSIPNSYSDGCDLEIVFNDEYLKTLEEDKEIIIEYSATLNEEAEIGNSGNTNDSYLEYGEKVEVDHDNDPNTPDEEIKPKTPTDTTTTYAYSFDLVKTDSSDKLLDGAIFELYNNSECTGDPIKFAFDGATTYMFDSNGDKTKITVTGGKVTIKGLEEGKYYLKETQAPGGYNPIEDPITIAVNGTDDLEAEISGTDYVDGSGGIRVINNTGSLLPSTGGIGTTIFYIVGGALVLFAVVLLVTKKRMKDNQ